MSAFLGPDQAASETLLATDPDVAPWVQKYQRSRETVSQTDYEVTLPLSICFLRYYVELRDNHDWHLATMSIYLFLFSLLFQVDLINTLTKLSALGQQINYEAYTYPIQKIDISKLKL